MNYNDVYELQTMIEAYVASRNVPTLLLRNIGPRACVDEEKQKTVYDIYSALLGPDVMNGILTKDIIFVEFNRMSDAEKYAMDNFPLDTSGDPDFYILAEVYSENGQLEYDNK